MTTINTVAIVEPPVVSPSVGPTYFVTGLVSGLLSVIGLNPQATGGPATRRNPPTLWALLAWVRREIGRVVTPVAATTAKARRP